MNNQGWIGSWNELANVLRCFHCDTDEEGKFKVDGNITSFLGRGDEFVVGENAVYYVDGKPRNLVAALQQTSHGLKCSVIG